MVGRKRSGKSDKKISEISEEKAAIYLIKKYSNASRNGKVIVDRDRILDLPFQVDGNYQRFYMQKFKYRDFEVSKLRRCILLAVSGKLHLITCKILGWKKFQFFSVQRRMKYFWKTILSDLKFFFYEEPLGRSRISKIQGNKEKSRFSL